MLGDPRSGSKVCEVPDREIGEAREDLGQIVAHRKFQPAAALHDRQNRRNLRSRLWAADVQPVFSSIEIFRYSKLCLLPDYVQSASPVVSPNMNGPHFERQAGVYGDTTELADCP
jgi:hypothetical protein